MTEDLRREVEYLRSELVQLGDAFAQANAERARLTELAREMEADWKICQNHSRALHALLEVWRKRLAEVHDNRALRMRRRVVRWRSLVEKRRQTGPAYPCVMGATGGSGTRVFARIAEAGGMWIGADRNASEDAMPIERFLAGWLIPYWKGGGDQPPHPAPLGMDEALETALAEQFAGALPQQPLGWKNPRNIYILSFLAQRFPDLRFIHVVRDGRDMALSSNQGQLVSFSDVLLSQEEQQWPQAERSIALWSLINGWAERIGRGMGPAYLRIRFEDLCADPVSVTRQIFRFFELPGDPRRSARLVEAPASLGRWRKADPSLIARLEEIGGDVLKRFGYR